MGKLLVGLAILLVGGAAAPFLIGQPQIKPADVVPAAPVAPVRPPKGAKEEVLFTPASSLDLALADIAGIPQEIQPYIRYLSLYNLPPLERKRLGQTISFVVNSLGTRKKPYIPVFVAGSDETLIRLNIQDYEWDREAWERLGQKGSGPRAQPEPYFHILLQKVEEPLPEKDPAEGEKKPTGKVKKVFTGQALWLDKEKISSLVSTTHSEFPILRGDWFISNVMVPPAYYDFLRLGDDLKAFQDLVVTNDDLARKGRGQDKAVVITSTVARNNRTITRSPAFTNGTFWITHDSKTSVDDRQYIRNLLQEKFDATEVIGSLPNGLSAYFLTNGEGKRVDFADPDIAQDRNAVDAVVRPGKSCVVCHAEGFRPIEDEIRSLTQRLKDKDQIRLLIPNGVDYYRVEDLFGSDLNKQLAKDQQLYADAIASVNGLPPAENAKQFGLFYDTYVERLLDREMARRDVGVDLATFEQLLRKSEDPVLLGLTRNPIRAVRRDQWERSFQAFMVLQGKQK